MIGVISAFLIASQAPAIDTARVSQAMLAEMQRTRAPGAAIAIVVDDRVVFAKGYGTGSSEESDVVNPGTLFRIGSVTKVMTALTALGSVASGHIQLDQPVGTYWKDLHPQLARLTLRQLLTHRAGLTALPSGYGPSDEDALAKRVLAWNDSVLYAEPGEMYSYSSPGYWLAGAAVEQVEHAKYADLVRRYVFDPLGMTASAFDPLVALTHSLALDHRRNAQGAAEVVRPYPNDASTWPGGSAFSNVSELSRLATALMNGGKIDGAQALPVDVARAVMTRQTENPGSDCAYTFGLGFCAAGRDTIISHYGFRSGSGAVFTMVPTKRVAVIILANIGGAIFGQTERVILDMIGVERENDAEPVLRDVARTDFARIAGNYVAGADTIRIYEQNGRLVWRAFEPEPQALRMGVRNELFVVNAQREPIARFLLVESARGNWFLTDGLNAFRRTRR